MFKVNDKDKHDYIEDVIVMHASDLTIELQETYYNEDCYRIIYGALWYGAPEHIKTAKTNSYKEAWDMFAPYFEEVKPLLTEYLGWVRDAVDVAEDVGFHADEKISNNWNLCGMNDDSEYFMNTITSSVYKILQKNLMKAFYGDD